MRSVSLRLGAPVCISFQFGNGGRKGKWGQFGVELLGDARAPGELVPELGLACLCR